MLSKIIADINPDRVVNLGDGPDMPSLSSYDKGTRAYVGRSYKEDILAFLEFEDRVWSPLKARKKKLPHTVYLEGNHEHRIERALDQNPEMSGTISFSDLSLSSWYDEVVRYTGNTPGTLTLDGVTYAHYMISGVLGRPISGEHLAHSLLSKKFTSCIVGHNHTLDFCVRSRENGTKLVAISAPCFVDYKVDWSGEMQKLWSSGILILRDVEDGDFDPEFVSLKRLVKEYG